MAPISSCSYWERLPGPTRHLMCSIASEDSSGMEHILFCFHKAFLYWLVKWLSCCSACFLQVKWHSQTLGSRRHISPVVEVFGGKPWALWQSQWDTWQSSLSTACPRPIPHYLPCDNGSPSPSREKWNDINLQQRERQRFPAGWASECCGWLRSEGKGHRSTSPMEVG